MMKFVRGTIRSSIKTNDDKSNTMLKRLKMQTQVIQFDELDYSRKENKSVFI